MKKTDRTYHQLRILLGIILFIISVSPLNAQTYSIYGENSYAIFKYDKTATSGYDVVYTFTNSGPGGGQLIQASNGLLYGMTYSGGIYGDGSIFSFDAVTDQYKDLFSFDSINGFEPQGSLIQATNGLLYGMTTYGGSNGVGVAFSYDITSGKETTLVNFNKVNGAEPFGSLIQAKNGLIYGTTYYSSSGDGQGTLFSIDPTTGIFTVLENTGLGGPGYISLMQARDGLLYGTGEIGGSGFGSLFAYEIGSGILYNVYSSFVLSGAHYPLSNLVQDSNNIIYGTTEYGAKSANGNIFSYNGYTNTVTTLFTFDSLTTGFFTQGGFTLDSAANVLYGFTDGGGGKCINGTMYSYNPNTSTFKLLAAVGSLGNPTLVYFNTDSITGVVYQDNNSDCIYDGGDSPLPFVTLKIMHNGMFYGNAITNSLGQYKFPNLVKGYIYDVELDSTANAGYTITCPLSGILVDTASKTGANIAAKCNGGFDLFSNPDFCINDYINFSTANITACLLNNRCQTVNGSLKIVLDTAIHVYNILSDSIPSHSGDTLIWKFDSVYPGGTQNTCVELQATIDSLPTGDSVKVSFIAFPIAGDSVPGNNILTYWLKPGYTYCTGYPYDPNGKTVSPAGNIPFDQRLTYTIHFQNTGTSTANTVVVVDTLSPELDVTTLQVVSSSAPVTTQIINGNALKFTFSNINLPDTAVSKIKSLGDVVFSIKPIYNVSKGSKITNVADIYFDANPAIITNQTINMIDSASPASVEPITTPLQHMAVFPNPFKTSTSVVFNNGGKHYLEIDDLTGRTLNRMEFTGTQFELQAGNLAEGIYILKAFDADRNYIGTLKLILVR